MRLKSLSIKGFKSFADDTVINFSENLIGIVGPNGSGKSNIVDAVRWVLGEQKTSELRLDSMSDVLFNGTKTRKEGRVARATLTFDNTKNILPTDYNEVSISRILYRDGSSEYRLNDVTCRKKDITSLFIDSGIGSNSYAIISLNMVEDILHDNGGSRRYMIEQAAGITKYKIRKKETQSKLRSTKEDLDRVSDLLFEIEKNMSSFERQAKRTEKFNALKESYKNTSPLAASMEVNAINESINDLSNKVKTEKDHKLTLETEIKTLDASIEKHKKDILKSELSLNQDQKAYNTLIENLSQEENNKNLLNQRIINTNDQIATNQTIIVEEEKKIKVSADKVELIQSSINTIEKELNELKVESAKAKEEFESIQKEHQSLRQRENLIKIEAAQRQQVVRTAQLSFESLKTEHQLTVSGIEQLQLRVSTLKENSKPLETREKELDASLKELTKELDKINQEVEKTTQGAEQVMVAFEDHKKKLQQSELNQSSLQQRIKFLKNVIEKNEGVPQSVAYLQSENKALITMSDLITVTDDRYTGVVELFFQDKLHHIIAKDRLQATELLKMVSQAQKGKANLIIESELFQNSDTPELKDHTRLIDVLTYLPEHKKLIEFLTHNVYIATSKGSDQNPVEGVTILDHEQYRISTRGALYGGSNTLFEGVQLGRKQILENLQKQYDQSQAEAQQMQDKLSQLKDKVTLSKNELNANQIDLHKKQQSQQNIERELYQITSQISNQHNNLEAVKTQISEAEGKSTTLVAKIAAQEIEVQNLINVKSDEISDEQLAEEISASYNKMTLLSQRRDESNRNLYQKENQLQLLRKDSEFQKENLVNIEHTISSKKRESELLVEQVANHNTKMEQLKANLAKQYQEKETLQKRLNSYEDTYYKEKGKIFEMEKKRSTQQQNLHQRDNLISNINEKLSTKKFDLQAVLDRCDIEFGVKINTYEPPEGTDTTVSLQELVKKRDSIQHKIRNFGEINPMAITAYNEIKERHEYITKERDDVLAAQQSLEDTITEIEDAASSKFTDSLDLIKVNFKKVFQGLFSDDDDCDIILLDAENPLDARIEIVAKPKGKKPKSISQLSGGEKTLTAASFLFALYLLKPAPFCIFDEVDAPLDDVNVLKFNKIIREFSEDSQFIVITHNKLTMSEVDILYGVFLKEQGVSGVSAVDFRTYDQTEFNPGLN
jgi:chromosome segregation protein